MLNRFQPIIVCAGCFQMIQGTLQDLQSMSITDLLRNSNDEVANAVAAPFSTQNTSTSADSESLAEDASASELSFIPPSSESIGNVPQSSESLTNNALPSSLDTNNVELRVQSQAPEVRDACQRIMNAPGPRSLKRRRVLELLNNLQPDDVAHSQEMLDYLEAQNEAPIDMQRFMKKFVKHVKPQPKRRRVRREGDTSSISSGSVNAPDSSRSLTPFDDSSGRSRLVIDTMSQTLHPNQSQQAGTSANAHGASSAVAESSRPIVADKTPQVPVAKPTTPRPAPTAPVTSPDPPSSSSSSSSQPSSEDMQPPSAPQRPPVTSKRQPAAVLQKPLQPAPQRPPQPVPQQRPPQATQAEPHSNMGAPRRVNYDYPAPSASNGRNNRIFTAKNLGG